MNEDLIRAYAGRLRLGVLVAFALVTVLVICGHFGVRVAGAPVVLQSHGAANAFLGIGDGILILLAAAIYWLSEALRAVAAGELFSTKVVRRFRLFSLWMLIMALFSTIMPMILSAVGPTPDGRHRIVVIVDVRDLLLVGLTLVLLLIARMFERARALQDEMDEIV